MTLKALTIRFDSFKPEWEMEIQEKLCEWLDSNSTQYLVSHEISSEGKPHFQGIMYLDLTVKSIDAWRKNIKDLQKHWINQLETESKRNRHSVAVVEDEDNYIAYVTKDKDIRMVKGFTEEQVAAYMAKSYTKQPKGRKRKAATFAAMLYEEYVEKHARFEIDVQGNKIPKEIDMSILVEFVMDSFSKNTKVFDDFIIIRFVKMIEYKLYQEFGRNDLKEYLINKLIYKMINT